MSSQGGGVLGKGVWVRGLPTGILNVGIQGYTAALRRDGQCYLL